ncbi:MAG: hypothetical protein ACH350_07365 [Parachlamydiaceae bacterium]
MKKLAFCLLACFACLQFNHASAAVAPFGESVLLMEAVLNATVDPEFSGLFSTTDVVVRLDRLTKEVNKYGRSKYILETVTPNAHNFPHRANLYLVTVDVQPNPAIGPNIITVLKMKEIRNVRALPKCDRNGGIHDSSSSSSR